MLLLDFETFVKVRFEGNEYEALKTLAHEAFYQHNNRTGLTYEALDQMGKTMSRSQLDTFWELVKIEGAKNPDRLRQLAADYEKKQSESFSVTSQELIDAEVNTSKAQIGKTILKFMVSSVGVFVLSEMMRGMSIAQTPDLMNLVVNGLATVVNAYFSVKLGSNVINYIKQKKISKNMKEETIENSHDQKMGGRSL